MTQASEAPPVCPNCGAALVQQLPDAEVGSNSNAEAAPSVVPIGLELPEEIASIGRSEVRSTKYLVSTGDASRAEQLDALTQLEAENRDPGADLRAEAEAVARHPELTEWLLESDRIIDPTRTKGRADLVRQRRHGILRHLEGEDLGFPIHQPIPRYRLPEGQGYWLLRLRDELEWLCMPVLKPTATRPYPRPTKDRLNHREARAILDWKASHLDMWLADRPHLLGGRLTIDSSRGVTFDTNAFVYWVYALMN